MCRHNNFPSISIYTIKTNIYTEKCIVFSVIKIKFKERSFAHLPLVFICRWSIPRWKEFYPQMNDNFCFFCFFFLSLLLQFDYNPPTNDIELFVLRCFDIKSLTKKRVVLFRLDYALSIVIKMEIIIKIVRSIIT